MERKFYQNYVVNSKEEAFVILKLYIEGNCGNQDDGFMDENICNVFTPEESFGKDLVDTSCCFLVGEELDRILDDWINCDNITAIALKEGLDSLDEDAIVKSLYEKMVGSNDLHELYKKDIETFGEFKVSWYKEDLLFNKFEKLNSK